MLRLPKSSCPLIQDLDIWTTLDPRIPPGQDWDAQIPMSQCPSQILVSPQSRTWIFRQPRSQNPPATRSGFGCSDPPGPSAPPNPNDPQITIFPPSQDMEAQTPMSQCPPSPELGCSDPPQSKFSTPIQDLGAQIPPIPIFPHRQDLDAWTTQTQSHGDSPQKSGPRCSQAAEPNWEQR